MEAAASAAASRRATDADVGTASMDEGGSVVIEVVGPGVAAATATVAVSGTIELGVSVDRDVGKAVNVAAVELFSAYMYPSMYVSFQ